MERKTCPPTPEFHNKNPAKPFDPLNYEESTIFKTGEDISKLYKGDLYILGRLWIDALRLGLVGREMSIFPEVTAKCKSTDPQKPPPMKYEDLPITESPHADYGDHIEKKYPDANLPTLQYFLFPHVQKWRKELTDSYKIISNDFKATYREFKDISKVNWNDTKDYLRDDEHLTERQIIVTCSTALGFISGLGKTLPNKLTRATVGALAAGSLCFPKKTDEYFKKACKYMFRGAKVFSDFFFQSELSANDSLYCKAEDIKTPKSHEEKKIKGCVR